jgi:hypothetical protein
LLANQSANYRRQSCCPEGGPTGGLRNIRTVMMIILDMPVATTAMVIMVVSDISIMAVGGMSVRQRVSASRLRSR